MTGEELKEYKRQWYQRNKKAQDSKHKEWKERNAEKYAAYRKKYTADNKEKIRDNNAEYKRSERGKETANKTKLKNALHLKCRQKLAYAVRMGRIKRGTCHCGLLGEAHHEDYSKPLEIIWLCTKHHAEHHRLTT